MLAFLDIVYCACLATFRLRSHEKITAEFSCVHTIIRVEQRKQHGKRLRLL